MAIMNTSIMSKLVLAIAIISFNKAMATKPMWHELDGYTFERYIGDFGKVYTDTAETLERKAIFESQLHKVQTHNSATPTKTWRRGINHLSDRTATELKGIKGLNKGLLYSQKEQAPHHVHVQSTKDTPSSVDWRNVSGVLTAVKDQGECGSCWTFASTEALESQWFLKTGLREDLSEQFILDCTPNPMECGGTGGCAGGTAELAYARLKLLGGIPSEYTYPYISGLGGNQTCKGTFPLPPARAHSGAESAAANVTGFVNVMSNDAGAVMDAVANIGPLAISVDAGDWHDYESGIFSGGNHTNPDLDHLVQLVGYSNNEAGSFWIVRNSWTPEWGDKGFIMLAQSTDCGTDITPLDGNGCKNGPPTVKVCGQNGMLFDAIYPLVLPPSQ